MSEKYKTGDDAIPHFVTFTIVGWVDVFSRELYKEKMVEIIQFYQQHKNLTLHAWVIMTNHIHLIISSEYSSLPDLVRDIKKYSSRKITELIVESPDESRKEWMLNMFRLACGRYKNASVCQLWQFGYHPVELCSNYELEQRLDYLHENPVRAGIVSEPWQYKYSSAVDYYTNNKGLLEVDHI
jgi:putative transposase